MRRLAFVVLACVLAASCGGSGSPTTPSNPPFNQTQTGTVSSFGTTYHPLTTTRAGNLSITLTWPSSSVDLDLTLTPTSCVDLYSSSCSKYVVSDKATGTSEQVLRTVAAGESYKVWIDNLSFTTQNYTLVVTIQ